MKIKGLGNRFIVLVLALAVAATFVLAQGQRSGQRPEPDALRGLKRALEEANAPALTADQESQLKALVAGLRENLPKPDESLRAAHTAYDNAVLAGDLGAAQAQAAVIAGLLANQTSARLQAEATVKVQALNILKSNEAQIAALEARFGTTGLARLLGSISGGPRGGFGPGFGRGFGPGGRGPGKEPGAGPGRPSRRQQ